MFVQNLGETVCAKVGEQISDDPEKELNLLGGKKPVFIFAAFNMELLDELNNVHYNRANKVN